MSAWAETSHHCAAITSPLQIGYLHKLDKKRINLAVPQNRLAQAAKLGEQALALAQEERSGDAIVCYEKALDLARNSVDEPMLDMDMGAVYSQQGNFKKGRYYYKRATELAPGFEEAWYGLGVCQGELKQFKEAKQSFLKAIELAPEDVHGLGNLGEICRLLGDLPSARKYLERGLELAKEPADKELILCSLSVLEKDETADKAKKAASATSPQNQSAQNQSAQNQSAQNQSAQNQSSHNQSAQNKPAQSVSQGKNQNSY